MNVISSKNISTLIHSMELILLKSMHLVKITDFKWKNQNSIHLVLQKSLPENKVFTGIEIKYPKSMLFGNIKCWGNVNGVYYYPSSNIENASLVPLLSMPIETEPNLGVFQYWFTESFLPWSIAKNYIQEEDILSLLNKNGLDKVLLNYLTYRYNYDRKFQGEKYDEKGNPSNKAAELCQKFEGQKSEDVIDVLFENWKLDNPTTINDKYFKIFKQIIYMLSNYTYSKYSINKGYNDDVKLFLPYYFELLSIPKINENYWIFEDCVIKLKSSYFNFSGWIGSPPEPINYWKEVEKSNKSFIIDSKYYIIVARNSLNSDWKIFKLKNNGEKGSGLKTDWGKRPAGWIFTSNDIYLATGNLLDSSMEYTWGKTKKYENYIKSVYRWDAMDEPNTPFISPTTRKITDWNLKQQLNVNNNKDNEVKVNVKNKDISENPTYQLEENFFNWLSITNELETNNIPSLISAEIKLSDGEYGKYLTNLIVYNDKIENYLKFFSQRYMLLYSKSYWMSITKNLVEDNIKINFDEKIFNLNQIEISGIWGYGNYDITIYTGKEQININNLELFNKSNEKISLITLEI